jgi:hypothetical protein
MKKNKNSTLSLSFLADKRYLEMLCVSHDCCDAYTKASQLLVEFSTFPMYCTEHYRLLDHTCRKGKSINLIFEISSLILSYKFEDFLPFSKNSWPLLCSDVMDVQ